MNGARQILRYAQDDASVFVMAKLLANVIGQTDP
jgi:hypothetical protein